MTDARIQPDAELAALAAAHAEGSLTPELAARLERRCADDPTAMRTYLAYLDLEAELSFARVAESNEREVTAVRKIQQPTPSIAIPLGIAAALFIACGVGVYLFTLIPEPAVPDAPAQPIATLIENSGDNLTTPHDYPAEGNQYTAGEYTLDAGRAQFVLTNLVTVDLKGKTRLVMHHNMHATLTAGSASFNCPRGAEGYTVTLPGGARVVDLGTRFNIELDESNRAKINVSKGAIEVRTADGLAIGIEPGTPLRLVDGGTIEWIDHEDIDIVNASFEEPALDGEPYRHGATGWKSLGADEQYGVNGFGPQFTDPVPDGSQLAFINSGAIGQTLDRALVANRRYTLTVAVGNRPGTNSPDYTLELHAGERLLASAVNPASPDKGRFAEAQLVFDCPADHPALGEPLRIVLRSNGSLATQTQNHFDNARLRVEPIPASTDNPPASATHSAAQPSLEGDPR